MPTAVLAPSFLRQLFDNSGNPLAGGKLFTYAAGTTTKATTYTGADMSAANANPITLDAAGRASVWLVPSTSYKFVCAPSTDTADPPSSPLWTLDTYTPLGTGVTSRLYSDPLSHGTPNTTPQESIIKSYPIPANTLTTMGQTLRITWTGTTAANGNNKRFKIRLGEVVAAGDILADYTVTSNNVAWKLVVEIMRSGSGTSGVAVTHFNLATVQCQSATTAAAWNVANTIGLACEVVAANDIVGNTMLVELLP